MWRSYNSFATSHQYIPWVGCFLTSYINFIDPVLHRNTFLAFVVGDINCEIDAFTYDEQMLSFLQDFQKYLKKKEFWFGLWFSSFSSEYFLVDYT